jgi:hypothetical protein
MLSSARIGRAGCFSLLPVGDAGQPESVLSLVPSSMPIPLAIPGRWTTSSRRHPAPPQALAAQDRAHTRSRPSAIHVAGSCRMRKPRGARSVP